MDNEGLYLEYDELILELYLGSSSAVTSTEANLSNKTVDAGGDIYDIDQAPKIGDVIYQAGNVAIVIAIPSAGKVQIDQTGAENPIVDGPCEILNSPTVPRAVGEELIKEAMDKIDEATGQFFNKRTGTFQIEGDNIPVMWFPVPIIEITKLVINSTDLELDEGEDKDFVAFKGRQRPQDDRRNPRIKLNVGRGRDSIYVAPLTTRVFAKNTLTTIEGSFGFLEPDGSTPRLIKKATKLITIGQINKPITETAGTEDTGPLKRLKVDLHEEEFFELKSEGNVGAFYGDAEVEAILAKYKTPIRISGSVRWRPYDLY